MEKTKKMTTFTVVKGDALDLFFKSKTDAAFMHGANCQRVMGAGIANQVRLQLSPLFYRDQYDTRTSSERFGSYSAVVLTAGEKTGLKVGVNLYTQYLTGANFDITAFRNSLKSFVFSIPENKRPEMTLYMPKIGCGIGGGDWDSVRKAAKSELREFNVVIVEYVPTKKEEKK